LVIFLSKQWQEQAAALQQSVAVIPQPYSTCGSRTTTAEHDNSNDNVQDCIILLWLFKGRRGSGSGFDWRCFHGFLQNNE
jgi:hypothetical protein